MPKVRVLPEILAHQIAAGEIIERPASVVKELMENSLDAGASQVLIKIEEGGRKLLQVRDNGCGMSREDAELAFQHHATSKISVLEDLSNITTLGFRGEALPSIAAVSRLRVRTVENLETGFADIGTDIAIRGGVLEHIRDAAWPGGTEISVRDLFFNVPARRKFLKAVSTEMSHITRQVTHYALAYPGAEFSLHHQDRQIIQTPVAQSLEDRVYQLLGESFLENLVPLEYEGDGVMVRGFTSLPHEQRSSARSQYLFVNRRMVRDKVMAHAIRLAYRDLIPQTSHPVVLLFLEIDPQLIDVNVHPNKTEIRFRRSDSTHRAIYHAIETALVPSGQNLGSLARTVPAQQLRSASNGPFSSWSGGLDAFFRAPPNNPSFSDMGSHSDAVGYSIAPVRRPVDGRDPHAGMIPETAHFSPIPVILGQFVESFIVAVDREGVLVVDQHVAHERILYDRALAAMEADRSPPMQRLLMPLTIELTPEQKSSCEDVLDHLNANGFEVDWFGERTLVVKGVPAVASGCQEVPELIEDVLDTLAAFPEQSADGSHVRRIREKIAIDVSCRSAIKINTPLPAEKMQWLIDELFRCENPHTCPHGRPIVLRMGIEDVLRGFKRI